MSTAAPLARLGILEKVARMDCPSRSHYVFHSSGKILGYYGNSFSGKNRGCGQRGNLRVPRQCLRKIMMDTLIERDCDAEGSRKQKVQINWGKKLVKYKEMKSTSLDGYENDGDSDKIELIFEDGSSDFVHLLIGADGVRSVVMQQLLSEDGVEPKANVDPSLSNAISNSGDSSRKEQEKPTDLVYTGIMIVLGITKDFFHPLLDERGFYTLDGKHRLFTMPFEGSRISDLEQFEIPLENTHENLMLDYKRHRRYMWQLSYKLESLEEASILAKSGPQTLLNEVLKRTNEWHKPVEEMIRSAPLETIWGTPLMDREPNAVYEQMMSNFKKGNRSKIVVLGDSIHSMSPFKGQGCNQALQDGPLLSSWLEKSAIESAIKGFMREMTQRTNKKVMASREAAALLHSEEILLNKEDFAGVKPECVQQLLQDLEKNHIGASSGMYLDDKVLNVIQKMNALVDQPNMSVSSENQAVSLELASRGDLAGLRKLSLSDPISIQNAKDNVTQETCLHLAAKGGHYDTCKWLISEACLLSDAIDCSKQTPLHKATTSGEMKVITLIAKALKNVSKVWGPDIYGETPLDLAMKHCKEVDSSFLEIANKYK